jgi:hypothetical protein
LGIQEYQKATQQGDEAVTMFWLKLAAGGVGAASGRKSFTLGQQEMALVLQRVGQQLSVARNFVPGLGGLAPANPAVGEVAPAAGSSSVPEIVLGKQGGPVERLAEQVGGQHFKQAGAAGVFDPAAGGWGSAFVKWMNKTIGGGKKAHFELEGVNINDALTGNPAKWITDAGTRYTEWELQTIMRRPDFFKNTEFYLKGKKLTPAEVEGLGIKPQTIGGTGGK